MRSLIGLGVLLAACSGGGTVPDGGGSGGGSSGGGSGGGSAGGSSQLAGCEANETPPGPVLATVATLVGGWHYWGTSINGVETAETNACEVAKSFHFRPVGTTGGAFVKPVDAGEYDAGDPGMEAVKQTACASAHGVPIPLSTLGVSQSAYFAGCLVPCSEMDIRVLWDHATGVGLTYQYSPDAGTRQLLTQRYRLVNGKLLLTTTGTNGELFERGAGALYCY